MSRTRGARQVLTPAEWRDEQAEAELQRTLIKLAGYLGYLTYHNPDSRRSTAGYPDLHIVGHGLSFLAELKSATGPVRPAQDTWLEQLTQVKTWHAGLIRPADLDDLEELLRRHARRAP